MTVIEMVWEELKDFREETGKRLVSIETEVKRTNGRVTKLEGKPDSRGPWYADVTRQPWFPWLIAFIVVYVGPKAATDIFNSIIGLFKH